MTAELKLPVAYNLVKIDTIDSTNDEAKRLASLGDIRTPDGTLIWALNQTHGKN